MNKDLKQITEELDALYKLVNTEKESIPYAVVSAWTQRINQAKDSLPGVELEYQKTVLRNSAGLVLNGTAEQQTAFLEAAKNDHEDGYGVVGCNVDAMYNLLANPIEAQMGHFRKWHIDQTIRLAEDVRALARQLGLPRATTDGAEGVVFNNLQDTRTKVRDLVRATYGDSLFLNYMQKNFVDTVRSLKITSTTIPVVLIGNRDDAFTLGSVMGKGFTTIDLAEDAQINPDYVTKAFKEANKKLKALKKSL
jgi:hypothetical protein